MRKSYSPQQRLDSETIESVQLNLNCRDEIVPILASLQYIYSKPELRDAIVTLIAEDVNNKTRRDIGRQGLDDWQILVLAAVRLGCNLDYDKLQDLAEQHRALRHIMGIGDWDNKTSLTARRIEETLCRLQPETIDKIKDLIVAEGHRLDPEAATKVRVDSFVVETNIHYPTESSLIFDGLRKILPLCFSIAEGFGLPSWRQHEHLLRKIKNIASTISRLSASKAPKSKTQMKKEYRKLLQRAEKILPRAKQLIEQVQDEEVDIATLCKIADLQRFIELTEKVCGTAYHRLTTGESAPNEEKLFSIFEPHTQLYRRGKAAKPNQFGRLAMVYEDGAGFVTHYHVLPRDAQDADVVVSQTRRAQELHDGSIESASFDRGFDSPENEEQLMKIIQHPCLPKRDARQFAEQQKDASVRFREARQRHPGIESAIGALQSGNGLSRCRDRGEVGLERYIALGILGRNLHVLGKLLIQQRAPTAKAAISFRKATA